MMMGLGSAEQRHRRTLVRLSWGQFIKKDLAPRYGMELQFLIPAAVRAYTPVAGRLLPASGNLCVCMLC